MSWHQTTKSNNLYGSGTGPLSTSSLLHGSIGASRPHSSYLRAGSTSEFIELRIACSGQQKGSAYHLSPKNPSMSLHIHDIVWEVFVTPPENDIDDLTREDGDLKNRPLWETPAGLFLAGVFSVDTPNTRWFSSPLSSMCAGPLNGEAQHVIGMLNLRKPLLVPSGAAMGFRIDVKHNWRPAVPVTLRCTFHSDLSNQVEFG